MQAMHLTILTGASRGMGLAMAQQLLAANVQLLCISRQTNSALAEQAKATGAALLQWPIDLSEGAAAAAQLGAWLSRQDPSQLASATLINNAGVIPAVVPLRDADATGLAMALRVGLEAPMQLCAAFLGATKTWQVPRKVLNISSGLGRRAMASQSAYCAAKAGMDHLARSIALEEAALPNGARVESLAPGVIDTDMQVQLRAADPSLFSEHARFMALKTQGVLDSPDTAAAKVLRALARPDFGQQPVTDVRDGA